MHFKLTFGYTGYALFLLFWATAAIAAAPLNDQFVNAAVLTPGFAVAGTTEEATLEAGETAPVGITASQYSASTWWAWDAPSSGWCRLTINGGSYGQLVSVWTGISIGSLTPVHSDVSLYTGSGSPEAVDLYFLAAAGTRYSIAAGIVSGENRLPFSMMLGNVTAPPVYNPSLTVSPAIVDVTASSGTANVVLHLVSTIPVIGGFVWLDSLSHYLTSVDFSAVHRTSGTDTDGIYTVPISFPRYLVPETYRIAWIRVFDEQSSHRIGELAAIPFAANGSRTVAVLNGGATDTTGPVLTNATVSPAVVDVTTEPKTVTVTLQISDPAAGLISGQLSLERVTSNNRQSLGGIYFGASQRTVGTAQNGTYVVEVPIRQNAMGDYRLIVGFMKDAAGNYADAVPSTDPAFPGPFTGTVRVNRTPTQVLNSFTLSQPSVDVTTGAAAVTVTCSINSGDLEFGGGNLTFQEPTTGNRINRSFDADDRTSGTAMSGTYSVTFPIPRYFTPGTYAPTLHLWGEFSDVYGSDEFPFPTGATTSLNVVNAGPSDAAPPTVTFLSAAPHSFTRRSTAKLNVRARVMDDLSGVAGVYVVLVTADSRISFGFVPATLVSGTPLDGIWEVSNRLLVDLAPGNYAIRFEVRDAAEHFTIFTTDATIAAQSFTVTETVFGYSEWASQQSLIGTNVPAGADADQDGASNLIEFAFGMAPQAAPAHPATLAAAGLPAAILEGSGAARRLALQFWVPYDLQENALELTYLAQFSNDGTTWTDVPQASFAIDGSTALDTSIGLSRFCTVRDPAIYSPSRPRFGRIRVTYNP